MDIKPSLITGSSNLTYGGMKNNLELNLGIQNLLQLAFLRTDLLEWFDGLWNEADLLSFIDQISTVEELYEEYTPYEYIFLIVLWHFFLEMKSDEANEDESEIITLSHLCSNMELLKHSFLLELLRILDKYHGLKLNEVHELLMALDLYQN